MAAHASAGWQPTQTIPDNSGVLYGFAAGGSGKLGFAWITDVGTASAAVQAAVGDADGTIGPAVRISDPAQKADGARIAIDGQGGAVAVWLSYDGASWRATASSRPAGGSWAAPATLSAAGQDARTVSVAVDRDGDAAAIWQRARGTAAVVQSSQRPAGGSWSAAADVSSTGGWAPRIALDGVGNATAIWLIGDDSQQAGSAIGYADHAAGGSWTAPLSFSDPSALVPALDVAPDGRAAAIWMNVTRTGSRSIRAISRPPGGVWDTPVTIGGGSPYGDQPALAVDDDGTATALWGDGNQDWSARVTPGGRWSDMQLLAGPANGVHPKFSDTYDARVVAGAHGETLGSWRGMSNALTFGEVITRDATSDWTAPLDLNTTGQSIAMDDEGNGYALWSGGDGTRRLAVHRSASAPATGPQITVAVPDKLTTGGTATMTATVTLGSSALNGPVRWDFGDGTTGTGTSVTHPYGIAGAYTVRATATDANGLSASAQGTITVSDPAPPPGPKPIAAYSFENGSGTTLSDVSGHGHTGTIREATWTTTGKNGRALKFDGKNDWVTIADAPDLRLTTGMTLEAWVNPTKATDWRTAIMKERSGDLDYALYASGEAKPSVYANAVGGMASATGPKAPAVNTWTHLAATFDASTVRLYVNGALVASAARSGSLKTSNGALRLGGNNVWGEWFVGQMDDVRIYNQALTATQIQTDMSTPVA